MYCPFDIFPLQKRCHHVKYAMEWELWNYMCILYVFVYWRFTSHATIFPLYMWRHRCAGGLKKLYLRSTSQRHRHFVGFFNVPVLDRHGATLFIRLFRETGPFSRLLRHAGDTEEVLLTWTPDILTWEWNCKMGWVMLFVSGSQIRFFFVMKGITYKIIPTFDG